MPLIKPKFKTQGSRKNNFSRRRRREREIRRKKFDKRKRKLQKRINVEDDKEVKGGKEEMRRRINVENEGEENITKTENQKKSPDRLIVSEGEVSDVDVPTLRKQIDTNDVAQLNVVETLEADEERQARNEMSSADNINNVIPEESGINDAINPSEYLKINKIETSKDKIKNHPLSEQNIIPRLGTSCILNGTTGQGKSTLLTNLITDERFFGSKKRKYFDFKFLTSPTAQGDDVQKELGIDEEFTFTDLNEAPDLINVILKEQKNKIKEKGSDNAPQILMIYDDVVSNPAFMKEDPFVKSFIASRHYNMTTFICSQSWTSVPRKCRLQAKNIFFFAAPLSEVELLALEYCPPGLTKKQFYKMVEYATFEPFSFMYINKSVPMSQRYRKNLYEILNIDFFKRLA